ncbi:MAG: pentapeptide repeat-containing protein [Stellaceae bacterium]
MLSRRGRELPPQKSEAASFAAKATDLQALRDAVVDAASVGAGLWLSYLFVLFYFAIAAGAVSHRDLLLENPVKLPFLNVELPLKAFFVLGPLVFLIVHAYVLLHFVLMAGKIGAFQTELEAQIDRDNVKTEVRRQLPSNLFVQSLAGPPEMRTGVVGFLLRLVIRISLVAAPIALLVLFQLQFLPYHREWITNWQRIAVVIDLALLWTLWPSIARGATVHLGSRDFRRPKVLWWLAASSLPVLLAVAIATFPGEWLEDNLPTARLVPTTWEAWTAPSIEAIQKPDSGWTTLHQLLVGGDVNFVTDSPKSLWSNVLVLPDFKTGDRVKFDAEGKTAIGSDALSLRGRNLQRAVFIRAHLDKADFTGAPLQGANFTRADLREAKFECDDDGSNSVCAQLQGANFNFAQLQGADLRGAQLQGAYLSEAELQGANLSAAQLQGADLSDAQLQGANLSGAQLHSADMDGAFVWRATAPRTNGAKNIWGQPEFGAKSRELGCINIDAICDWSQASYTALRTLIEKEVPANHNRGAALNRIEVLEKPPDAADQRMTDDWPALVDPHLTPIQYLAALAGTLQQMFCTSVGSLDAIAGLIRQLEFRFKGDPQQGAKLAGAFLDEAKCPAAHGLSEDTKARLRQIIDRANQPPVVGTASR